MTATFSSGYCAVEGGILYRDTTIFLPETATRIVYVRRAAISLRNVILLTLFIDSGSMVRQSRVIVQAMLFVHACYYPAGTQIWRVFVREGRVRSSYARTL